MGDTSGWIADGLAVILIIFYLIIVPGITIDESEFIEKGCSDWDNTGRNYYCEINNTWYEAVVVNEELVIIGYQEVKLTRKLVLHNDLINYNYTYTNVTLVLEDEA